MRVALGLLCATLCGTAHAQSVPQRHGPPPQIDKIKPGSTFNLRPGAVVELSASGDLLTFAAEGLGRRAGQSMQVTLDGRSFTLRLGRSLDVTRFGAEGQRRGTRTGNPQRCSITLVDLVSPQGAPTTASFRYECR